MSKITWSEYEPDIDLNWTSVSAYEDIKQRHHLLMIRVTEKDPGSLDALVHAVVTSLVKEVEQMRELLANEGVDVRHELRTTAGRYALDFTDHGSSANLSKDHYLVTHPAEEPGNGMWDEDFDYEIEHPDACTPEARYDGLCPFVEEEYMVGRDAYGDADDWGEAPFRMRIEHVVNHYPGGPWGGDEWETYIAQDPEEE